MIGRIRVVIVPVGKSADRVSGSGITTPIRGQSESRQPEPGRPETRNLARTIMMAHRAGPGADLENETGLKLA